MPAWVRFLLVTVPPADAAEAVAGHREQVRALDDRGSLRTAGELGEQDGFVEVFEAADRREAEEIARSSPLVRDGLGTWILRPWRDALSDEP